MPGQIGPKDGTHTWYTAKHELKLRRPPAIAALLDADVSSTPPAGGQALVWNSTDKKWEPGASVPTLPIVYFANARYDFTINPAFSIPFQTFTKLPLLANSDPLGLWDDTNHWYTVPVAGTYQLIGKWRPADSVAATDGADMAIGIDKVTADGPTVVWGNNTAGTHGSASTRTVFQNILIETFSAGDQIRLFAYCDTSANVTLDSADFSIVLTALPA